MARVEHSIEVNVPVRTAYNQWTQFEEFPKFMDKVEEVKQLDDKHMHWRASMAGKTEEWDAVVSEQIPDERIAWTSTSGATNAGVVTFHYIDPNTTRVMLQLDYEPEGVVEKAGSALGIPQKQIEGDMERFKKFIEARGQETGAWRGEVDRNTGTTA
ncbi:MAG TPA: SRPBCC family protein [Thermomicrobiales bacterium]|jgi:uncharacterized membrane protein